ncbi:hypothetical protein D3C73_1008330 [compost metagenome]
MQRQVECGVGIAVGISFGLHIEQHAEIALADEGNSLRDQLQRTGLGGYAAHLGQAGIAHRQQPLQQGFIVIHQRLIFEHRQLQVVAPEPGCGLVRQAFGA